MNLANALVRVVKPVGLAHLRPFRIGDTEIRPASREIISAERREVLEPRVMQVLVALACARGETLSRDDLIAACWEGRAVSDDAINRVVSRLRALAREFGTFEVKTIVKVGYRLIGPVDEGLPETSEHASSEQRRHFDRRMVIGGGAAVATAAIGATIWGLAGRHRPTAEALDLYRRAQIAERQGVTDQSRQTISFYEQAVRIDPRFSEAWGSLALAYTHLLEGNEVTDPASLPPRVRSAAAHALALDPVNADARAALAMIKPSFRNWADREHQLRQLAARYPRHWLIHGRLAIVLYEVGRLREGIAIHREVLKIDPLLPVPYAYMVPAMMALGLLDEAETALKRALEVWPAHPILWNARYQFLLFSGQAEAAAAFLMEPDSRPSGVGAEDIAQRLQLARAAEYHRERDVSATLASYTQAAGRDVTAIPSSASVFAFLGRADLCFASLERYLFDRGTFGVPAAIGPLTRRSTNVLFGRPLASARSDPRFADLLKRIGLESYWRETGTAPDYRRTDAQH